MNPVLALISIIAIAVGGGAAGALNMWYDADIDGVMGRTTKRPIPSGRISKGEALGFGMILSLFSVMTLALAANALAGAMLAFTIFFYVVIYTMWLKRSTPQNIVIGGAAGAFPPMIGWTAVTGTLSWESAILFLIVFLWTRRISGAGARQAEGLRRGQGADDAQYPWRGAYAAADPHLHRDSRAASAAAGVARLCRPGDVCRRCHRRGDDAQLGRRDLPDRRPGGRPRRAGSFSAAPFFISTASLRR